ncbi:hypothetical protein T265_11592 [Opisthorchis viverrini]|uniref:Uncharacterized protein n=1 Tax=Opisthorchis viverrini TaxID=6198 RepID=A0A074Z8Z9_OPIVI|nr:hypothetical protein T265_11592 [Opisthorchis viverrini]KER19700.1 hypothetical protein T265_11592 [Opisthorchis viverrini]
MQERLTKNLPKPVAPPTTSPAPRAHNHEPSTSISGHPQMLSVTSTMPKRSTAYLRDTVTNQLTHEAVVEDGSTALPWTQSPTVQASHRNPFSCTTSRASSFRPSSTHLPEPILPHKIIRSPSNRATHFFDRISKPQIPLRNHSPCQVPPLKRPAYHKPGIPFRQLPTTPQPPPPPKPRPLVCTLPPPLNLNPLPSIKSTSLQTPQLLQPLSVSPSSYEPTSILPPGHHMQSSVVPEVGSVHVMLDNNAIPGWKKCRAAQILLCSTENFIP